MTTAATVTVTAATVTITAATVTIRIGPTGTKLSGRSSHNHGVGTTLGTGLATIGLVDGLTLWKRPLTLKSKGKNHHLMDELLALMKGKEKGKNQGKTMPSSAVTTYALSASSGGYAHAINAEGTPRITV